MNRVVAYQLLASKLETFRSLPYEDLARLVGQTFSSRVPGEDAVEYDVEIALFWSNEGTGKILVDGTIGPVVWGGPFGRLDEHFVVPPADLPSPTPSDI